MNTTFSTTFPRPVACRCRRSPVRSASRCSSTSSGSGSASRRSSRSATRPTLSGNDLLLYWEEDEDTDVILMYLESFGNPRKFSRIARRISRTKPIVAVKSGRTGAGERAASSHTAAISAGDTAVGRCSVRPA
jgi:acetate---CoA ligase (ADP-forming)